MPFTFKNLLICVSAVAALVYLRLLGPVLVTIALLACGLWIAIGDVIAPFKRRTIFPKTDGEYYLQFEPRPKLAILLVIVAIALYAIGWTAGAFAEPGKRPSITTLSADIVITVVGLTFCFYARKKSSSYFQTALTWIPCLIWLLHTIVLLGHGMEFEPTRLE